MQLRAGKRRMDAALRPQRPVNVLASGGNIGPSASKPKMAHGDRTGWLGRLDSNQGMAESKSSESDCKINAYSEKRRKFRSLSINRLSPNSEWPAPPMGSQEAGCGALRLAPHVEHRRHRDRPMSLWSLYRGLGARGTAARGPITPLGARPLPHARAVGVWHSREGQYEYESYLVEAKGNRPEPPSSGNPTVIPSSLDGSPQARPPLD
jgi:hypothetical protein